MTEVKKILEFLEDKYSVKFQLKLIEGENDKSAKAEEAEGSDELAEEMKGCRSELHNTDYLGCIYYYKKNY